MQQLNALRTLKDDGDIEGYLVGVAELVTSHPDHVLVRIEAAFACDRFGTEEDAVIHYDAAWGLGVPPGMRREFLIGYGSTLRNVGRFGEAVEVLRTGAEEFSGVPVFKAFLALALHSAGEVNQGLALAIDALIDAGPNATGGYTRALTHYRDELLDRHTVEEDPGRSPAV